MPLADLANAGLIPRVAFWIEIGQTDLWINAQLSAAYPNEQNQSIRALIARGHQAFQAGQTLTVAAPGQPLFAYEVPQPAAGLLRWRYTIQLQIQGSTGLAPQVVQETWTDLVSLSQDELAQVVQDIVDDYANQSPAGVDDTPPQGVYSLVQFWVLAVERVL